MFQNCYNLTYINSEFLKGASQWKSSLSMFEGCKSLNDINFPFVEANLLNNTSRMFLGCSSLNSINLEGLTAGNITSMAYMFSGCINLIYLNIYNLNTDNNPSCYQIFEGVSKKIKIIFNRLITGFSLQKEIDKLSFE